MVTHVANPMNLVFFGLGSIGARHLRLLRERFDGGLARYFAVRSGVRPSATPDYVTELRSLDDLPKSEMTVAFICNPTALHVPTALECARRGMHLFLEKPISHSYDGVDELRAIVAERRLTAYVAYPLRFLPVVDALASALRDVTLAPAARGHVRYVVSSYLPSWRDGTDSRDRYSAQRALGGGVILDLSHEVDLLHHLFGDIEVLSANAGRIGDVTIDCDEYADGLLRAERFDINLHMNFCSLHEQRSIDVDLPEAFLGVDLRRGTLVARTRRESLLRDETTERPLERDDMFRRQLDHFFTNLGRTQFMNDLERATRVFRSVLDLKNKALSAASIAS